MRIPQWVVLVAWFGMACGGGSEKANEGGEATTGAGALPSGKDPCTLVARSEMEAMIGVLAEPPYRVDSDRQPKVDGEGCFYRARDRRNVTILVDWEDGEMAFRMLAGTGTAITDILSGYDATTDTLEGAWDKVGAPFGQFIALKGKTSIQIDPLGSRIGLDGAARLASIAINRLDSPLDYIGAKATLARGADAPRVRNPCELVTRREAEALMGALKGDPKPSPDNADCSYATSQEFMGSPIIRTLKVTWVDGFYALGQERMGIAGAAKTMAAQMDADMPALSKEATGEAEPWDERIILLGGVVTVVKGDVMLQINGEGMDGFDEARALAFLRIAARRL